LRSPVCLLIADTRRERFPLVAAQWAMLRGMQCWRLDLAAGDFPDRSFGPRALLAISYPTLTSLDAAELRAVKNAVAQGASLYVRGGFPGGATRSLSPFGSGVFTISPRKAAAGYRISNHGLLPRVLRNEAVSVELALPAAQVSDCSVEGLAFAGATLPFVFAIRCGAGVAIYDLLPDQVPFGAQTPIVRRLAQPAARCSELGALAAVNHATQRDSASVGAYNLLLDDRPRNFDYFNAGRVARWLANLESLAPGTHVDFAWTPNYGHPGQRYIQAVKQFKTGFVWHGLFRHIDHRRLADPGAHYERGLRRVEQISRRYGVRFQPIMVLPFQEVDGDILLYLRKAGFRAAVFHGDPRPGLENPLPPCMHYSTPLHDLYLDYLPALRRFPAPAFTRDWMLANAALDLPIIAAGHPVDVGLRRYAPLFSPLQPVSGHFDQVLAFAREKGLRPMALEDIAVEMIGCPSPTRELMTNCATLERIDVAV